MRKNTSHERHENDYPAVGRRQSASREGALSVGADAEPQLREADGAHCACAAFVTPESHASGQFTIQNAVDRVFAGGGDVCLAPGRYFVPEPVKLAGAQSVALRGQGSPHFRDALEPPPAVGVHVFGPAGVLAVQDTTGLTIENLSLESTESQTVVRAHNVTGLRLRHVVITVTTSEPPTEIHPALSFEGRAINVRISHNQIIAPVGIAFGSAQTPAEVARLYVEGNMLACENVAIALSNVTLSQSNALVRNQISGSTDTAIVIVGTPNPDSSLQIQDNELDTRGSGIRVGAVQRFWSGGQQNLEIADNAIRGSGSSGATFGVAISHQTTGEGAACISRNRVRGFEAGIALSVRGEPRAERELRVEGNLVEECGAWGILAVDASNAQNWCIVGNRLLRMAAGGIGVWGGKSASISGNAIRQLAVGPVERRLGVGVFCDAFGNAELTAGISDNELNEIGPEPTFEGSVAGMVVGQGVRDLEVRHNRIQRSPQLFGGAPGNWAALLVGSPELTRIGEMTLSLREALGVTIGVAPIPRLGAASVVRNTFIGGGNQSAVRLLTSSALEGTFSDNVIYFNGPSTPPDPPREFAVFMQGDTFIITGNRISGSGGSLNFETAELTFNTVLGNITENVIRWKRLPFTVAILNQVRVEPGGGGGELL